MCPSLRPPAYAGGAHPFRVAAVEASHNRRAAAAAARVTALPTLLWVAHGRVIDVYGGEHELARLRAYADKLSALSVVLRGFLAARGAALLDRRAATAGRCGHRRAARRGGGGGGAQEAAASAAFDPPGRRDGGASEAPLLRWRGGGAGVAALAHVAPRVASNAHHRPRAQLAAALAAKGPWPFI